MKNPPLSTSLSPVSDADDADRFWKVRRTVPRNIPMKFHRSNIKTEGGVCESLKIVASEPTWSISIFVLFFKIGPKKQKFKIPLQRPHADSAKEHSYEVSSF